jgi:hypothetical protein
MEKALKDLGEKLFGGFSPHDRLSELELTRLESQLNIRLPTMLRRFYLLVGRNSILTKAHNRFLRPHRIRVHNNALVFLEQNQKVMFWGILLQDLHKGDPPVQQGNFEEAVWYPDAHFLSVFLFGIVGWQAANGMPWTGQGIKNDQVMERIQARLTYLDPHLGDKENDLRSFYGKDLVVSVSRSAKKFLVGSNKRSGLERFEKAFAIRLDYL